MNAVAIADVDYSSLPEHMQQGARDYVEKGYKPGGFLRAVLSNQLVEAFARADQINRAAIPAWAAWVHDEAPQGCWGSPEKVKAWLAAPRAATHSDQCVAIGGGPGHEACICFCHGYER